MEGIVVSMGLILFFLGTLAAFAFPMLGIKGKNSVMVTGRRGSTIVTALGIPLSLALLGIVAVAVGMYLP